MAVPLKRMTCLRLFFMYIYEKLVTMEVNYIYVFIIATIIAIIYNRKEFFFTSQKPENEEEQMKSSFTEDLFLLCCPIGLFTCLFCWIFSSNVIEIEDYKYSESDYFIFYKDFNKNIHIIVPFTNYISNNSNKKLENIPICYGSHDIDDYQNEYFEEYEFSRIRNKPEYFFETPPSSIRIKGSGAVRYLLTTKEDDI